MNAINPKNLVPGVALILLLAVLSQPTELSAAAIRSELENIPGGITIEATPPPGTSVYAVEETLPSSAFPRRISHNGVYDSHTNKVKWGPFHDDLPRNLTFEVSIGDEELTLVGSMSHDNSGPIPTTGIGEMELPNFETYFAGWQHRYLPKNTPLLSADYVFSSASLPLIVQYAMGQEPGESGSPLRMISLSNGENGLRYVRDLRRTDISIELQSSENLVNWNVWSSPPEEIETIDEYMEAVRVPSRENAPFYRIGITEEDFTR
jgi:hypothetical protein